MHPVWYPQTSGRIEGHCPIANPLSLIIEQRPQSGYLHQRSRATAVVAWIVMMLIGYWTGLNPGLDSGGNSVLVWHPSKEEHLQTGQPKHE